MGGGTPPDKRVCEDFDPDNFDHSTNIDNQWLPVVPGTRFVWEGSTQKGSIAHRLEFTATDMTKVIDGVRTLVSWERDFSEGQLIESELVFLAQDNDGNVSGTWVSTARRTTELGSSSGVESGSRA